MSLRQQHKYRIWYAFVETLKLLLLIFHLQMTEYHNCTSPNSSQTCSTHVKLKKFGLGKLAQHYGIVDIGLLWFGSVWFRGIFPQTLNLNLGLVHRFCEPEPEPERTRL